MKPETQAFLDKAAELLGRAPALLAQDFTDEAGRAAYLAGFHAAQGLIFEARGATPKTHSGVQAKFAELARNDARFGKDLRTFLGRAYSLKAIADYETGLGSKVSEGQARDAIESGRRFVAAVVASLSAPEAG
ncbi:MAG: HEPN domain-containing protein [Hyphomicrobiales bacterium]|nr:HEPN domain-containing protein [Hyphomicrobiales bacterium]MBV8664017.1 HEPN domain-containing protein [Hyphomicrobiales bacterium]